MKDITLSTNHSSEVGRRILNEIMKFRRVSKLSGGCKESNCQKCSSEHLCKIVNAIEKGEPINFVLPAFPGKSPNLEKVLGVLPDHAEELSLSFLGKLCEKIKSYYSPGIKIILCSDGRVFSDVVGMKETNVTDYQVELSKLIDDLNLCDISTFNLEDVYKKANFFEMREELMSEYGNSLESLRERVRRGKVSRANQDEREANQMYCGITRFLLEDSMYVDQKKSRSALQKESRSKAYEVIRRSNAWSELIEDYFPDAVRLSIHPQVCGSKK